MHLRIHQVEPSSNSAASILLYYTVQRLNSHHHISDNRINWAMISIAHYLLQVPIMTMIYFRHDYPLKKHHAILYPCCIFLATNTGLDTMSPSLHLFSCLQTRWETGSVSYPRSQQPYRI